MEQAPRDTFLGNLESMANELDSKRDAETAAVLAAGLQLGVIDQNVVVRWADDRIARLASVPDWLIELSLSKKLHVLDVVRMLNCIAGEFDRRAVFVGVCAMLPDLRADDFDGCEAMARRIYGFARNYFAMDWTCLLLCDADEIVDEFGMQRDGLIMATREAVADHFRAFVDRLRDEAIRRGLSPFAGLLHQPTADR
jgi:hypothetical protein